MGYHHLAWLSFRGTRCINLKGTNTYKCEVLLSALLLLCVWELQEQEVSKVGCSCSTVVGETQPSILVHLCKPGPPADPWLVGDYSLRSSMNFWYTGDQCSVYYSVLCLRNFRLSPLVTSFLHETSPLPASFLFPFGFLWFLSSLTAFLKFPLLSVRIFMALLSLR